MPHITHRLLHFLPARMQPEVKELYSSTLILNFGLALIFIFEPIYLYHLGYSLQQIMFFWLLVYVAYFFFLPLGAMISEKYGYEHTIFYGTFFWVLLYLCMYLIGQYSYFFYITPIVYAFQKSVYWPAYHSNFAKYSASEEEGREISVLYILSSLNYVVGPILGGWILSQWGFNALFITVALIMMLSNVPMLLTKEVFQSEPVHYLTEIKAVWRKANRHKFFGYLGFGEELIALVVWPIFISLYVTDFLSIGGLVAIGTLVTAVVTLIVGRLSDKTEAGKILHIGACFYFLNWLARLAIARPLGVLMTDTVSQMTKNTILVPMITMFYRESRRPEAIHQVLFLEMTLAVGKVAMAGIMCLLLFIISGALIPFYVSFVLAALFALLYLLL
ncbi:MAG: hypothetical protein COX77_04090 [Candidatus Komeilibacteria bacterium CG_4_10_14_0_2_um_filter_37_10]|uniref:Major facilitator superfamily (MFS) profile domain-containing protein n=1 Tax=Candidatus Komeilibacteria bacterium CG_4_10_14_0_2_um_filter_37_10 TaxID=1974470 RepID=A0A2M7VDP3_9BACT|nr:MAG: hypothetical protein COX77_04090 [Candidatus Komeilibacteria bacterium CG_4_10_14_0_2_um_filter_37_10]